MTTKIVTIRCSTVLKDWIDKTVSYNRSQVSIVTEAIVLYNRIYLYLKPYLNLIVPSDFSCTIRPVLSEEQYNLIVRLSDRKETKHYNSHIRIAIYTYYHFYPKLKVYNLFEVDKDSDQSLLTLLYDLELIIKETGELKCLFL